MKLILLAALLSLLPPTAMQTVAPDAEGFIRNWLVLAPVAIDGESGASEIERDLLGGEATLTPKAGDKVSVGSQALTWTAHKTDDYFIDFLKSFGAGRGEYVAGYAVAYITASAETKLTLALGTNDQGKAWLNGKPVFKFVDTRTLEKDADRVEVTLAKGQNVLVLKVVNEVNNWQACARFLRNGAPATDLVIAVAPAGK